MVNSHSSPNDAIHEVRNLTYSVFYTFSKQALKLLKAEFESLTGKMVEFIKKSKLQEI